MRLIIVGAGITGAACAYTASALGAQVTLIDAERPGRATAAGAGIICPWTAAVDDPAWYDFARTAAREYPALIAALADQGEPDVSYRRVGALLLVGDQLAQAARQRLAARSAGAPEMGEVSLLDGTQAQELFPPLRPDAAAVHIPGAARVDGRQLAAALVRAAARQGATIRTGAATLGHRAGRVTGVSVDGDLIEADAVVAAAGTWTAGFAAPAGVTVPVVPQRGLVVATGLGATGLTMGPLAGAVAARVALHLPPGVDLDPFDPLRS
jgi:D-amino-acid dehydrogenase